MRNTDSLFPSTFFITFNLFNTSTVYMFLGTVNNNDNNQRNLVYRFLLPVNSSYDGWYYDRNSNFVFTQKESKRNEILANIKRVQ